MTGFDESLNVADAAPSLASRASSCLRGPEMLLRHVRAWVALILLMIVGLFPSLSHAACSITSGTAPAPVYFSPPSSITIAYNTAVGTAIYTSNQITPTNPNSMSCNNNSAFGITNQVGSQPATTVYTYPTSVSGLGYQLVHGTSTAYMYPYGYRTIANGSYINSNSTALILVKTGPIVSGSVLPAGTLAYWTYANSLNIESFVLNNSVTIIDPACSVVTTPINVTLPTVALSSMNAVGAVSGDTPFNIQLTCSSGATLAITLNYNGTNTAVTGVLSSTGTAGGVGVQLLNSDNKTPVSFGTTTTVGATPNGTLNLPYYAQYYRTGTTTAGTVAASATFTLSYQ